MTDENIDLRFLAEQGKRILDELGGMRTELAGMKKRTDLIPEIAVEVAALGVQIGDIKELLSIICTI